MSYPNRFLHADAAGSFAAPCLRPLPRPMDLFELQKHFWQLDAEQPFTPAETRFYFYWLNEFNLAIWPAQMRGFVKVIAAKLHMDEKTVARVVVGLVDRGLLGYKAGSRSQAAFWKLSNAIVMQPATDDRKNSRRQADNANDDRNFSAQVAEFKPRTSHDDRKNSGPYKEENINSSVVENRNEEVVAPAAASPASSSVGQAENKNTTQPASSKPAAIATEPAAAAAGEGRRPSPHADEAQLTTADVTPLLNVPATFRAACLDINPAAYAGINFEHYRLEIRFDSLEQGLNLMPYQWRKRLRHWLSNAQANRNGLVLAAVAGQTKGDPRAIAPLAARSSASPTTTKSWS